MCPTAATTCLKIFRAAFSCSLPSLDILANSSPPQAYSITMCNLDNVSITSYSLIILGWWSFSIEEISLDNSRCVFWSNFVLSSILMATFSAKAKQSTISAHRREKFTVTSIKREAEPFVSECIPIFTWQKLPVPSSPRIR